MDISGLKATQGAATVIACWAGLVISCHAAPPPSAAHGRPAPPPRLDLAAPPPAETAASEGPAGLGIARGPRLPAANRDAPGGGLFGRFALQSSDARAESVPAALVQRFHREGLPLARLWESHHALLSLGLNQRGRPGLWLVQKTH